MAHKDCSGGVLGVLAFGSLAFIDSSVKSRLCLREMHGSKPPRVSFKVSFSTGKLSSYKALTQSCVTIVHSFSFLELLEYLQPFATSDVFRDLHMSVRPTGPADPSPAEILGARGPRNERG